MPLLFSHRTIVPPTVVSRAVDSRTVLLNAATGRYFALDEVGARVWTLVASSPSVGEVYASLLAEYDVEPDVLQRDLEALLTSLEAEGLLELRHE